MRSSVWRNSTNSFCLGLENREVPHQIVYSLLLLLDNVHEILQVRLAFGYLLVHQGVVLELALDEVGVLLLVLLKLLH